MCRKAWNMRFIDVSEPYRILKCKRNGGVNVLFVNPET